MMRKTRWPWLSVLCLLFAALAGAQEPAPAEPKQFADLREKHDKEMARAIAQATRPVLEEYVADLQALESQLSDRKDHAGAAAVQNEVKRVRDQLKAGAAGAAKASLYTDNHRGLTGFANRDNVYRLKVDKIGSRATARFYIHPMQSPDSAGKVLLRGPGTPPVVIRKWKPKDFVGVALTDDWTALKPTEENVGKYVTKPGDYELIFQYESGKEGLVILRAEIEVQ